MPTRTHAFVLARFALAFALLLVTGAHVAEAQRRGPTNGATSIWGARTLRPGQHVLSVGGGWPSAFVQYDLAPSQRFGLGLRGDLYYGSPFYDFDTALGLGFSVPMRIHLYGRNKIDMGLGLRPGITIGEGELFIDHQFYDDGFGFGLHLGDPAFLFNITPIPTLTVFARAELQIVLVIGPNDGSDPDEFDDGDDAFLVGTLGFVGGVEFHLSRTVNLFVLTGVGPGFQPSHCYRRGGRRYCDRDGLFFRFAFGASFTL